MYKIIFTATVFLFVAVQPVFADSPVFFAQLTSNQTVTSGVQTPVLYDNVVFNTGFTYSAPTTTILTAGFYQISASQYCNTVGNTLCQIHIYSPSGVVVRNTQGGGTAGQERTAIVAGLQYFNVGDTIIARCQVTDATAPACTGSASRSWLTIALIVASSTSSSATSTASSTTYVVDSSQDLFYGILLFLISFWGIIWFFRRNR